MRESNEEKAKPIKTPIEQLVEAAEDVERVLDALLGEKTKMGEEEIFAIGEKFTKAIAAVKAEQTQTKKVTRRPCGSNKLAIGLILERAPIKPYTVGQLVQKTNIPKTSVSKALNQLKSDGLVRCTAGWWKFIREEMNND